MTRPGFLGRIDGSTIFLLVIVGLVIYLVGTPLILLFISSLQKGLPLESYHITFENIRSTYLDPTVYKLLWNTLAYAVGSLGIGFTFGIILAWLVERTNIPSSNSIYVLVLIPTIVPGMISAIAWIFLLGPKAGLINSIIRDGIGWDGEGPFNIFSLGGMCFVSGLRMVPTIFILMTASFRNMDPALEEAGSACGANQLSIFRRVTFPLMLPAILAAFIYYMVVSFEAFEVPGVLGMPAGIHVFSTRIFWATHPAGGMADYGTASSLALFLLVLSFILLALYRRTTRKADQFTTVTGKAHRPRVIDIGRWRYGGLSFFFLYFFLAVLLPLFVLVWGSLKSYYSPPTLEGLRGISLQGFRSTWEYPGVQTAFKNTIILGVVSATATMVLVSLTSWIVVRSRIRGRMILDALTFVPQGIPGIVLGLALMYVYLIIPIPIYGTLWIMVVANVTLYLSFASRTMTAAIMQIHKELEEAAQTSGVSWRKTFIKITLPLTAPALISGWLWVAIHSIRELSSAIMLYSPDSIVLPTIIWSFWDNGRIPETCVLGVILIIMLAILTAGGRLLISWGSRRY